LLAGNALKILLILALAILACTLATSTLADPADLTVNGFDPTGRPTANVGEDLGQQTGIRYAADLLYNENDPVRGNRSGTITIVEFFDYRCPHCLNMVDSIERMIRTHANLRVIYKLFPILGPASDLSARAALAANQQNQFPIFNQTLIQNSGVMSLQAMLDLAKSSGMDVAKFKADMNSERVEKMISTNINLGERMGINGTPTLFVMKSNLNSSSPPADVVFLPGEADYGTLLESYNRVNQ
jgi:protein-disulfide isomerase